MGAEQYEETVERFERRRKLFRGVANDLAMLLICVSFLAALAAWMMLCNCCGWS